MITADEIIKASEGWNLDRHEKRLKEVQELPPQEIDQEFLDAVEDNPERVAVRLDARIYVQDHDGWHRLCTGCNDYYPPTLEFWFKERKDMDTLSRLCKACYWSRRSKPKLR